MFLSTDNLCYISRTFKEELRFFNRPNIRALYHNNHLTSTPQIYCKWNYIYILQCKPHCIRSVLIALCKTYLGGYCDIIDSDKIICFLCQLSRRANSLSIYIRGYSRFRWTNVHNEENIDIMQWMTRLYNHISIICQCIPYSYSMFVFKVDKLVITYL